MKFLGENFGNDIVKLIEKEEKNGKIVYDSLLKLMDDFHMHIKNHVAKWTVDTIPFILFISIIIEKKKIIIYIDSSMIMNKRITRIKE